MRPAKQVNILGGLRAKFNAKTCILRISEMILMFENVSGGMVCSFVSGPT
jgi:hypothetical protein